jgi:hypothetical protein
MYLTPLELIEAPLAAAPNAASPALSERIA